MLDPGSKDHCHNPSSKCYSIDICKRNTGVSGINITRYKKKCGEKGKILSDLSVETNLKMPKKDKVNRVIFFR